MEFSLNLNSKELLYFKNYVKLFCSRQVTDTLLDLSIMLDKISFRIFELDNNN